MRQSFLFPYRFRDKPNYIITRSKLCQEIFCFFLNKRFPTGSVPDDDGVYRRLSAEARSQRKLSGGRIAKVRDKCVG